VDHLIQDISTASLERLVAALEGRLISGTCRADDVEAYIRMQWEIAERELGPVGRLDPRD
jgi:hypothetical protein